MVVPSQSPKTVVVKAAIVSNGRVLVLDPARQSHGAARDLPGGHVGEHEDPVAALVREVREETGLVARLVGPVRVWAFTTRTGTDYVGVTFAAVAESGDITLSREHRAYQWVRAEDIPGDWEERDELIAAIDIVRQGLPAVCATSQSRV